MFFCTVHLSGKTPVRLYPSSTPNERRIHPLSDNLYKAHMSVPCRIGSLPAVLQTGRSPDATMDDAEESAAGPEAMAAAEAAREAGMRARNQGRRNFNPRTMEALVEDMIEQVYTGDGMEVSCPCCCIHCVCMWCLNNRKDGNSNDACHTRQSGDSTSCVQISRSLMSSVAVLDSKHTSCCMSKHIACFKKTNILGQHISH